MALKTNKLNFLTGYPKSGNTWLRLFIHSYVHGGAAANFQSLFKFWQPVSRLEYISETLSCPISDIEPSSRKVMRYFAFKELAAQQGTKKWFHTHDAFKPCDNGLPYVDSNDLACVLFLVRHPFDVVVSMKHYLGVELTTAVDYLLDPLFVLQENPDKPGYRAMMDIGSWADHAQSWLNGELPCHTVRYEDLRNTPATAFQKIITALGLEYDEQVAKKAMQATNFDTLKKKESLEGYSGGDKSTAPFFRSGKSGAGMECLSDADRQRILDGCGKTMEQLGYC